MSQHEKSVGEEVAQHTPGPWSFYESDESDIPEGVAWVIAVPTECEFQKVIVADIYTHNWPRRCGESRANAQLIAAAPDLLAALEYALPYIRAAVPNPRDGANADCTPDTNAVARVAAAIAKAKGTHHDLEQAVKE